MKKLVTFFTLLSYAVIANAQSPITINASDMPIPTGTYNLLDYVNTSTPTPAAGANQTWDYSTLIGVPATAVFQPETDPFFTSQGIDVYRNSFKNLNATLGYNISNEYDFNGQGVYDKGLYVYGISSDLSSFTGSTLDSIRIPTQGAILSQPRVMIKFPFTNNSSWSSNSRRVVNFDLSVAAYGLNQTPAQHVWYAYRSDSIIGYGKCRIYITGGASAYYNVLMDQITTYTTDSFYLGGMPAPSALLTAFGISQGAQSAPDRRINFYRQGSYYYLASAYYGSNSFSSNPSEIFTDTDNITMANGIKSIGNVNYSTILYPNPSKGSQVNLQIMGKQLGKVMYQIAAINGQTVVAGASTLSGNTLIVNCANTLADGVYVITVLDETQQVIATEEFTVQH